MMSRMMPPQRRMMPQPGAQMPMRGVPFQRPGLPPGQPPGMAYGLNRTPPPFQQAMQRPMPPHAGIGALASQGRYGDSMLMHVNPQEVQGIANMLGTQPTINPQTGLPEAFSWKSLIPILAQIAVPFIPGVGAGLGALLAALGSGVATGVESKSLGKGLLSGISSLAIGGALNKLVGAGKAAAAFGGVPDDYGNIATAAASGAGKSGGLGTLQAIGRGLQNPAALRSAAMPGILGIGGIAALNNEYEADQSAAELPEFDPDNPWRMSLRAITPPGDYFKKRMEEWQRAGYLPSDYMPPQMYQPRLGYRRGGLVKGPGTGKSDSVPALINGRTPARLSNGEFVFTAGAVRGLGGGSKSLGARRLYNLMREAQLKAR